MDFTLYDKQNAPDDAGELLETVEKKYGFLPNLTRVMAEAPALLKGYMEISKLFGETSLSAEEQQILLLTASYENGCEYCVSAHSVTAQMNDVDESIIEAIRNGDAIGDDKLEAFRRFVAETVDKRGWPSDEAVEAFIDAGYGKRQILEVVLGIGMKTLSNYTNHIADTPLDDAFSEAKWEKAA